MPTPILSKNLLNPWVYFSVFLVSNSLLSYFPLPLGAKIAVGLIGLLLPFLLALTTAPVLSKPAAPPHRLEFLPAIPSWVWLGLGSLAVFARFYQFTTLSVWPHFDEGTCGYYALSLSRRWDWRLFYAGSQAPPLFIWGLAAWIKVLGSSLATLWLWPALLSLFSAVFAYAAARAFFSRSMSFLCGVFVALGFWPLFIGRTCLMTVMILPAECLALAALGSLMNARNGPQRARACLALGALTGLGFYIHLPWIGVAAWISAALAAALLTGPSRSPRYFWLYLSVVSVLLLPLFWEGVQGGYGRYFRYLWTFGSGEPLSQKLEVGLAYVRVLFWGVGRKFYTYQPVWGGFLNPVWSSLFFLGAVEIGKNPRKPVYFWLLAAFLLFMLQGILTRELEPLRVLPLLLPVAAISALGAARLLSGFAPSKAAALGLALLIPSLGLDGKNLFDAYHRVWSSPGYWRGYAKSLERYRAYGLLEQKAGTEGPGLIFSDFVPGLCDQTLTVADDGFNAARNPSLSADQATWAAVLANVHYQPFLLKRFGPGKVYGLSKDLSDPGGGWMLWVMPVTDSNRETLRRWRRASAALGPFIDQNLSYVRGQPYEKVVLSLQEAYPAFQRDPFLESCFWEKMSDALVKSSGMRGKPVEALENAVRRGYPAAHLFRQLGVLWLVRNDPAKARQAFQRAVEAPLDFTDSRRYLNSLDHSRPIP